jgi:uroporphyrinogen decarboxylase
MSEQMSKRERVTAAARGDETDRPPWSLWRHFYNAEYSAEDLAERMGTWAATYGFDFLKVNPRAEYHVQVWDAQYRPSSDEHRRADRLEYPVTSPDDWKKIQPRGLDAPPFAEQLAALQAIATRLNGEIPFAETVFSPLGVAGYLVEDNETLQRHIREHPQAVHQGLEAITQTFARFSTACLEAGADGIFYATTRWASRDWLTPEEYAEFGRPYDLRVLEAVRGASFNILHVCDPHNMMLDLADYPVQAFNWAATDPTNPSLAEAASLPGLRIGGISAEAMTDDNPDAAAREAEAAHRPAGDRRWALGPNCSIPPQSRDANIRAAGRAIGALR